MSADGLQVLLGQVDGVRRQLEYLESRLNAVQQTINGVSHPGMSEKHARLQGARSAQAPNANEATQQLGQVEAHIQNATRYVDSWLGELLRLIDL